MQHTRILIQSWIDESDRRFPGFEPLIVDASENRREGGGGGAGASDESREAFVEDYDVVADGGDVGIASSCFVVWYILDSEGVWWKEEEGLTNSISVAAS